MVEIVDLVIVGSGSAGFIVVIYVGRVNLFFFVFEGVEFGG